MTRKTDKVIFESDYWTIEYVTKKQMEKGLWGDANDSTKTVRVRTDLSGVNFLDTLIHELLHASAFRQLSEEYVESTANEIAKAIARSGRVRFTED